MKNPGRIPRPPRQLADIQNRVNALSRATRSLNDNDASFAIRARTDPNVPTPESAFEPLVPQAHIVVNPFTRNCPIDPGIVNFEQRTAQSRTKNKKRRSAQIIAALVITPLCMVGGGWLMQHSLFDVGTLEDLLRRKPPILNAASPKQTANYPVAQKPKTVSRPANNVVTRSVDSHNPPQAGVGSQPSPFASRQIISPEQRSIVLREKRWNARPVLTGTPKSHATTLTATTAPLQKTLSRPAKLQSVEEMLSEGHHLWRNGRIDDARTLFKRAADLGDPNAALAMGSTYDPKVIAEGGENKRQPDKNLALYWYRRAHRLADKIHE